MIGRIVGWSLRSRGVVLAMAAVVLGGLVTTTLLNLLFTPALNLRFGPSSERRLDAAQ